MSSRIGDLVLGIVACIFYVLRSSPTEVAGWWGGVAYTIEVIDAVYLSECRITNMKLSVCIPQGTIGSTLKPGISKIHDICGITWIQEK